MRLRVWPQDTDELPSAGDRLLGDGSGRSGGGIGGSEEPSLVNDACVLGSIVRSGGASGAAIPETTYRDTGCALKMAPPMAPGFPL